MEKIKRDGITVMLSKEEKEEITRKAAEKGLSRSAYIRFMLLHNDKEN